MALKGFYGSGKRPAGETGQDALSDRMVRLGELLFAQAARSEMEKLLTDHQANGEGQNFPGRRIGPSWI